MKRISVIAFILAAMLTLLASCSQPQDAKETDKTGTSAETAQSTPVDSETEKSAEETAENIGNSKETAKTPAETGAPVTMDAIPSSEEMFTDRDSETSYKESDCIRIELNGTTAAASDKSVKIDGSTVTITKDADYVISGTLTDGMIIVDAPDSAKMQIVLNGVEITSQTSAPICVLQADKVFLTTAAGTVNALTNGGSFTPIDGENIDAVIYSKEDLTLNGKGTLIINSPAGHGIVSKDDLVLTIGTYTINAASHGLDANDSVRIARADITITAGKDGIHAENNDEAEKGFVYLGGGTLTIEAEGDGISAGAYLFAEDGTVRVLAGGGHENGTKSSSDNWGMGGFPGGFGGGGRPGKNQSTTSNNDSSTSMKGLKSEGPMLITGGTYTIDSADDALHANTSLAVNGGTFTIATGDDALHAEENLDVTAGVIEISTSYEGLEAQNIHVSGGSVTLTATDDGLNAAGGNDESGTTGGRDGMFGGGKGGWGSSNSNGTILVSGGTLYINSSGDGMDANGTLTITGGHTTIVGPIQGDTATLDYDISGTITGGTFIGTGSTMMAQSFSDSDQGVVAVNAGSQAAGTLITLTDKDGNVLFSRTPELPFAVIILSSPDLVKGETYTLAVGELTGEMTAN